EDLCEWDGAQAAPFSTVRALPSGAFHEPARRQPRGAPGWHGRCSCCASMTTFVLPGRHQPPHNDHLALIRAALDVVPESLLVGVVFQRAPQGEPADAFEAEARAQHAPE